MIRTLLRRLIQWALAGAPETPHDPSDLDKYAAENKTS